MVSSTVILGADPAGLTAAYQLTRAERVVTLLEPSDRVGGLAQTKIYKGYYCNLLNQVFSTDVPALKRIWQQLVGQNTISTPPSFRIYYRYRLFDYPLSVTNALKHLGPIDTVAATISYLSGQTPSSPPPRPEDLETWLSQKFGRHLQRIFFEPYLNKILGVPSCEIQAEWAQHHITDLSLLKAFTSASTKGASSNLPEKSSEKSPENSNASRITAPHQYPALGHSALWKTCQTLIEQSGAHVALNAQILQVTHKNNRIESAKVKQSGEITTVTADDFISSLPVSELIQRLVPPAPAPLLHLARHLNHRAMLVVPIIVKAPSLFPDHFIYIQEPKFKVSRIQNYKNWSATMVPDDSKTCLGLEYFCDEGDRLWQMDDAALRALACQELMELGIVSDPALLREATGQACPFPVLRQKQAYPICSVESVRALAKFQNYLAKFENLQTIGRNGRHFDYTLADTMATGLDAAQNILNPRHGLAPVGLGQPFAPETRRDRQSTSIPVVTS